jgi:hypothetical protein
MAVGWITGASVGRGDNSGRRNTPRISFEILDLSTESGDQFLEADRVDRLRQMKIKPRLPSRF